jgi:hypothetical protein
MSSTQEARVRSIRPTPWAAFWPAFLGLSVLLLAPATAYAGDDLGGRPDAQSVDFQTIDAYVTSQMQSMHIPGVALGIVHGPDRSSPGIRCGQRCSPTHDSAHSAGSGFDQ